MSKFVSCDAPAPIPEQYADTPLFGRIADEMTRHLDADSSGHDIHHAWRVLHLGMRIAGDLPTEVDRTVLGGAALTHDVHRTMGEGTGVDPADSLGEVRAVLEAADAPEPAVEPILHCVAVHDDYDYRGDPDRTRSVEARILQDADNLDAMGAVGVARTFAFAGVHDNPLWDPTGAEYSGLYHFADKLLELPGEMNTDPARRIAEERREFLVAFRDRFRTEWFAEDG